MIDDLKRVAEAATPGPWYHVNPGMALPKTRTVHGTVPAERVDYVSTWSGMGTPPGHRTVVSSRENGSPMRSCDMAYIATFDPPTVLNLLSRLSTYEAQVSELREALEPLRKEFHRTRMAGPVGINADDLARVLDLARALKDPTQ